MTQLSGATAFDKPPVGSFVSSPRRKQEIVSLGVMDTPEGPALVFYFVETSTPSRKFYGIADAHGIESFNPWTKENGRDLFILTMRAEANRQRHAVVYVVELTTDTVDEIRRLLEEKDFKRALVTMKTRCLTIGFPDRYKESYERSWKMIPNDDLDPYYMDNPSQAKSNKYAPQQTSTQDSSYPTNFSDAVTLPPPNPNKPLQNGNMVRIVGKSKPPT